MSNKSIYQNSEIVDEYINENNLQLPEKTILNFLKNNNLKNMSMLDIGVGGGRTTLHFSMLVKQYIGMDYSEEMIDACNKRFSDNLETLNFNLGDVRDMSQYKDNTFDLILFSFNGLDYISHKDRQKALCEIHRVAKAGAYFCFSTHNLQCIKKIFNFSEQLSFNPKKMLVNLYYWFYTKYVYNKTLNLKHLHNEEYSIFNDGGHNFRLQTYYIKPQKQIQQLEENNYFDNIEVYSFDTGKKISSKQELDNMEDRWLYYLCTVK